MRRFINSEIALAMAALVGILVFASTADADWKVEVIDGVRVAELQGSITPTDKQVPLAMAYVINSVGGCVKTGFAIADELKVRSNIGIKVYYMNALSVAATIAIETNAEPLGDAAVLGFHWTYSLESKGRPLGDEDAQRIMRRVFIGFADRYGDDKAMELLEAMKTIVDGDQRMSMVLMGVTGKLVVIKDSKLVEDKPTASAD